MMSGGTQKKSESDTSGKLTPVPESRRDREYQEFLSQTEGILFVKEPVACVRAQMADEFASPYSRVFAWVRLNSWGKLRLWCMADDGTPAKQRDCAADLGLHKGTVSKCFASLQARGMIELRDNRIFPTLAPELRPTPDPDKEDPYSDFVVKWWRSSNPDLSRQLDQAATLDIQANALRKQAREIRRAIEPIARRDYEAWTKTGELPPQQLLPLSLSESTQANGSAAVFIPPGRNSEVAGQQLATELSPVSDAPPAVFSTPAAPVSDAPPAELQRPESPPLMGLDVRRRDEQTPVRPSRGICVQVKNCLKNYAHSFPELAGEPDDAIIEVIAAQIPNQAVFNRFAASVRQTAVKRRRVEKWAYFEPVARVARLNETRTPDEAKAEPEPPPDRIPPQTEEDMFAELKRSGVPDAELEHLRAKLASDRARSA